MLGSGPACHRGALARGQRHASWTWGVGIGLGGAAGRSGRGAGQHARNHALHISTGVAEPGHGLRAAGGTGRRKARAGIQRALRGNCSP
eukprot:13489804-Alexandrium_andersonii.AAC.1